MAKSGVCYFLPMTRDITTKSKKSHRLLFRLAAIFLGLFLAFSGIEIVLRIMGYVPVTKDQAFKCLQYDPELGWIGKKGFSEKAVFLGRSFDISINAEGFRDGPWQVEKKPGQKRVLLLGDSMIFGSGVGQEDRVSEYLAKATGAEVLPAGLPGWSPLQEHLWLEKRGLDFKPDAVIQMFTIYNDITDLQPYDNKYLPKPYLFVDQSNVLSVGSYPVPKPPSFYGDNERKLGKGLRGWWMEHTATYAFVLSRVRRNDTVARLLSKVGLFDYNSWVGMYLPIHIAALANPDVKLYLDIAAYQVSRTAKLCKEKGIAHLVFLIPTQFQVDEKAWKKMVDTFHVTLVGDPKDTGTVNRMVAEAMVERGIEVLDPLEGFVENNQQEPYLYIYNDGHWTEAGHEYAAQRLAPWVREKLQ